MGKVAPPSPSRPRAEKAAPCDPAGKAEIDDEAQEG